MPDAELSGPLWDQAADVAATMVRLAVPGDDGLIDPDPILGAAAGFRDSHDLAVPCLLLVLTELARRQDEDAATDLPATIPVKIAGRTKFVSHEQVRWVEAARDYVRLHTVDGSAHLVRMPISHLEERWSTYGFIRIHRGYLVTSKYLTELSVAKGVHTVTIVGHSLPVSRRHVRGVRDRILSAGRPNLRVCRRPSVR